MVVGELAHERDVIIIGGGPGGYHAAIRAAQLGRTVTLIEKEELGGICLNKGCIPSKIFTHGARKFHEFLDADDIGIEAAAPIFNIKKMQLYKNKTVKQLREGVEALCKANKIEVIKGSASFLSDHKIAVLSGDQYDVYRFNYAIIATGNTPSMPDGVICDNERILNAWSITSLDSVPDHLALYGFDYLSLEMAMAFRSFGSKITLIQAPDGENSGFDTTIMKELKRILKKRQIKILTNTTLREVFTNGGEVILSLEKDSGKETFSCSHLFVSVASIPNIGDLGLDRIGVKLAENNDIIVDQQCRTNVKHIFAIGDVTSGAKLAVKAIKQGKIAAETIAGIQAEADFRFLPMIAQTNPPIASVGLTEQEAVSRGYEIETGVFPLNRNGYASVIGHKEGLIKVIFDKKNHFLLGVHMIGYGAVELITSGIFSMEMAARDEDWLFPLYPHPSMNESLLEAVEAIKNQAIHLPPHIKI